MHRLRGAALEPVPQLVRVTEHCVEEIKADF